MGRFLWDEFKRAKETFEEASDALGFDVRRLCFEGPEADLALTVNTQPCLTVVSVATDRVLRGELGFEPDFVAGHSVGEYAAVVSAGALDFDSALRAVRVRGEAMQGAVPVGEGGMTAVLGLDVAEVERMCAWAERETGAGPIGPANLNAPGQIVISGDKKVLDWLRDNFRPEAIGHAGRVKFIPLKVSAPFHCAMMDPARETMRQCLGDVEFRDALVPVVQNVDAVPTTSAARLRENLVAQVSAPVRWLECVRRLKALGAERAVESGPGQVLTGLNKKIEPATPVFGMNALSDLRAFEAELGVRA